MQPFPPHKLTFGLFHFTGWRIEKSASLIVGALYLSVKRNF